MLQRIHIVLVETTHSGNIGSSARAMKTMGLQHLRLVNPQCQIDEQANALSAGAEDVLQNARIFPNFDRAIADCDLVIGASARLRHLQNTLVTPKESCINVMDYLQLHANARVAIVFGRERVGLTNEELLKCRYHLFIPTNPKYASLNLAMAVQIVCYELRQTELNRDNKCGSMPRFLNKHFPKSSEMAYFLQQTEQLYRDLGFIKNDNMMKKLQHLYQRANVDKAELGLLCGMLRAVENKVNPSDNN